MSRERPDHFYCPECGNKTLVEDRDWQRAANGRDHDYYRTWKCRHNHGSKEIQRRIDANWIYPRTERAMQEAMNKVAARPPCNCVITAQGRDAEISDYGTILDKLANADNEFKNWLLGADPTVHKKGFEILYQTDFMRVVRLRDKEGVGVWVYWEADRDSDQILGRSALEHQCALHIKFRDLSLRAIFLDSRFALWRKGHDNTLFSGKSLGKRMKAKIVEWATEFEAAFPSLLQEARNQKRRWEGEESLLRSELRSISHDLVVRSYDGHHTNCLVQLLRPVTPEQAKEIAGIISGAPAGSTSE